MVPDDERISDRKQEKLLLHATVEDLVRYDLALQESAADGRYLAFRRSSIAITRRRRTRPGKPWQ